MREQLGKMSSNGEQVSLMLFFFFFFRASNVATLTEKAGHSGAPPDELSVGSSC